MPARTAGNCGSLAARASISSAQATADWASGKTSMKASPICLTMRPLQAPTEMRTIWEKRSRTPAAATSPMASASGVKLERSIKTTAISRSAGVAAPLYQSLLFGKGHHHVLTNGPLETTSMEVEDDRLDQGVKLVRGRLTSRE